MINENIQKLKVADSDELALLGNELSNQLRHLADNEIDSDSFAVVIENFNGTEIEFERPITDLAIDAAGMLDKLLAERGADKTLINEYTSLLRECHFALETLINQRPTLAGLLCSYTTLGNLRASLYKFRKGDDPEQHECELPEIKYDVCEFKSTDQDGAQYCCEENSND